MHDVIEKYYRENYNKLVLIVSRRAKDLAEDIVQESFVRAISQIDKFDSDISQFSTWFAQKLEDTIKYFLGKQRAKGFVAYDIEYTWDPIDKLTLRELYFSFHPETDVSEIYDCILKESGRDQLILILSFEKGYTAKEISWLFKTNISENSIWKIIQRFKEKYNEKLLQFTRKKKSSRVNQTGSSWKALREKVSMDAKPHIKRLLCRPKRQRYKRWKLLRSTHSECRWKGPYGNLIIPILDNPSAIKKVRHEKTKEFLNARRKTLNNLRNDKRGI